MKSKNKNILIKKPFFLRYLYFSLISKIRKRHLMLLKTNRSIQVGLSLKKSKLISKVFLYKTLHFYLFNSFNSCKNTDYLYSIRGNKMQKVDYLLNLRKKKIFGLIYDSFFVNKNLSIKDFVPILLTKNEYNLYDRNYRILDFFNFLKKKKNNFWYLQYYDFNSFSYSYFLNLYNYFKNILLIKFKDILLRYKLNLTNNILFDIFKDSKSKLFKFNINNYVKFKNEFSLSNLKILDKYLIKHRMFRAGKFFYNYLQYMKRLASTVYNNNMFSNKLKYIKINGNKCAFKLSIIKSYNFRHFKGWFHIYNFIKKYTFLTYNVNKNKNKVMFHFIKKYHYFYFYIIRFLYKIIYTLKFMFIDKFTLKKILFLKIFIFYVFFQKWFKFKKFMRKIRRGKIKKWKVRRIVRFKNLEYVKFLFKIKSNILRNKFISRLKKYRLIKQRKRLTFYKYKNTIRIVNWLLKFRKLKSIKNPFIKFRRGVRINKNLRGYKNVKNLNKIKFKLRLKQLSNKVKFDYKNKKKSKFVNNVKRF